MDTNQDKQEDELRSSPDAQTTEDQTKQIVTELSDIALKVTEAQGKSKSLRRDKNQYIAGSTLPSW